MSGVGRGRGDGRIPDETKASERISTSEGGDGERTIRGRGGFRQTELRTIPRAVERVQAQPGAGDVVIDIMANFVKLSPMPQREVYQYRVDYEPNVESLTARKRLFNEATKQLFNKKVIFDGMSDARSGICSPDTTMNYTLNHPTDTNLVIKVTIKRVGTVTGSFEMIRVYNMHMKDFLRALGFYQISTTGAYIHPALSNPVGRNETLRTVRGYRTGANLHERDTILMNLESCHKLMQRKNVLQNIIEFKERCQTPDFKAYIKAQMIGKLVVASYNKIVYRVEDVNFDLNPASTFPDKRTNAEISFLDYYKKRYDVVINDKKQPLLLVIQNNKRRENKEGNDQKDIYVIPELCNIAGLTEDQRNDNSLKIDLIRCSQIDPNERVKHMQTFLNELHKSDQVREILNNWGYTYEVEPIKIKGRTFKRELVGLGKAAQQPVDKWTQVDHMASFDKEMLRENVAVAPKFPKLVLIISRTDANNETSIFGSLKAGFGKVGLVPDAVEVLRIKEGDSAHIYAQYLRRVPADASAALVLLPRQNKERYDAIKRLCSCERGLITQVVTARLMMDQRKATGAATKIAVQMAAKLGGEPWYVNIPLPNSMICGYDTYHDTSNRGRSYGAFVASMNGRYSRWYSKADSHDRIDELSSHMAQNLSAALTRYHELNKKYPDRLFIYRDGVGDGQLEHVFNIELKQIKQAVKEKCQEIKLTFVIVNKRIGARFFWRTNNEFRNPAPGSVIDDVVTRKERYDFYLISQSTRNGTVTPTYYNIIEDESGLDPARQQALAYKLCLAYYNWTGTVRVPAPCQYAHKLAMLCGENLHGIPNVNLNDRLHFL